MSEPLAIAQLLRNHAALKQRKGLFQGRQMTFFRYKRFVRALTSPEYQKHSKGNPERYPAVPTDADHASDEARKVFVSLISSQVIVPCQKLHSSECKEHDLKPNKDFPHLVLKSETALGPDEYYMWNYNPKSWWDYLIVSGVVLGILAVVCYPLWPYSMRRGAYYVSWAALGLLMVFFGIALIRLVLYLISLPIASAKGGFWLFPNLFEDCGVLESFKPLYGFGDRDTYSYLKKLKRQKKKQQSKIK